MKAVASLQHSIGEKLRAPIDQGFFRDKQGVLAILAEEQIAIFEEVDRTALSTFDLGDFPPPFSKSSTLSNSSPHSGHDTVSVLNTISHLSNINVRVTVIHDFTGTTMAALLALPDHFEGRTF